MWLLPVVPAAVGVEEVFGPGGGDAVFVPPAGLVAGGEGVEVLVVGEAGPWMSWVWSCCGLQFGQLGGVGRVRLRGGAGSGEDVEAEVAAAFGPFVVLFGQDGADEADDGVAVGEDPDDVGAAADLAVEPLVGVVRPDLPPESPSGSAVNARTSARAASRCSATAGSLLGRRRRGACRTGRARRRRRAGRRRECSIAFTQPPRRLRADATSGSRRSGCGSAARPRRAGSPRSPRPARRARRG